MFPSLSFPTFICSSFIHSDFQLLLMQGVLLWTGNRLVGRSARGPTQLGQSMSPVPWLLNCLGFLGLDSRTGQADECVHSSEGSWVPLGTGRGSVDGAA